MADQRLRLIAELKNNASPGLKQISKDLKEVGVSPGMEAATKWMVGFSEATSSFVKEGGGLSSVMGSIGIGGLTAAASMAGLVEQLKQLGDHSFAMKRLGQEAKMTIAEISRWEYVGQVFRVPQEQMDGALKSFGEQRRLFMQRRNELFVQMSHADPEETRKLLGMKDASEQFQEILRWISTIKDAAGQNAWMKEFMGTDALGNLLTNGFPALQQAIQDAKKNAVTPTDEFQKQSDLLNKSIVDFNAAWQNFEVNVGPTVFSQLKLAADDFRGAFEDIKGVYDWWQKNKDKSVKDFVDDNAKAGFEALKRQAEENDKARKAGKGPILDIPGAITGQGDKDAVKQRFDDLQKKYPNNPLFQKSAYVSGLDGSPFGSDGNGLSDGVKEGVLAAFREWAADSAATKPADGDKPRLQSAAYTTFGSDGPGNLTGLPGRRSGPSNQGSLPSQDTPIEPFGKGSTFDQKAPEVMHRLMQDFSLSKQQAAIVLGNLGHESQGFRAFHEKGLPWQQGGVGWAQWTGPRRREFEAWSAAQKLDPRSDEANYGFLRHELGGKYARAVDALRNGASLEQFERIFEGAGIKAYGSRYAYARRALHDFDQVLGQQSVPSLVDEARKGAASPRGETSRSQVDIHLHDRGGHVRSTGVQSDGVTKVNLRRGPTMTRANIEA